MATLLGQYFIDEGSGGTIGNEIESADLTIAGATWGSTGAAHLSFDGSNDNAELADFSGTDMAFGYVDGPDIQEVTFEWAGSCAGSGGNVFFALGGDQVGIQMILVPGDIWRSWVLMRTPPSDDARSDWQESGAAASYGLSAFHFVMKGTTSGAGRYASLYIDGVQFGGTTWGGGSREHFAHIASDGFTIGSDNGGGNWLNGTVAYWALYSGVLTEQEIEDNAAALALDNDADPEGGGGGGAAVATPGSTGLFSHGFR